MLNKGERCKVFGCLNSNLLTYLNLRYWIPAFHELLKEKGEIFPFMCTESVKYKFFETQ